VDKAYTHPAATRVGEAKAKHCSACTLIGFLVMRTRLPPLALP
jgi:hypothetical protein